MQRKPLFLTTASPGTHLNRHLPTLLTALPLILLAGTSQALEPLNDAAASQQPSATGKPIRFNIPAQPLSAALAAFGEASSLQVLYPAELAKGVRSPGVRGSYQTAQALRILLTGTGLGYRFSGANSVTLERQAAPETAPAVAAPTQAPPLSTGSQDTGAATLPTVTVTAEPETNFDTDDGFKAEFQTTATKSPLSIRETPQSISVITQDALKARQVLDIGTALQTSAGVSQVSGGGLFTGRNHVPRGQTQIRGISVSSRLISNDRVDGIRSPEFAARQDLAPYERIEVIKGPVSGLYGRGSAAGFVNRVSKKPLREFHAELAPTIGSFDFYRLDGDITGPLLESEKVRGRLVLAYEDSDSFIDGVGGDRVVVAPGLDIDLSPSTRLLVLGSYQRDEFLPNPGFPLAIDFDAAGKPVGNFHAPRVPRSQFPGVPNENENHTEVLTGTIKLEQDLGDRWLTTLTLNGTQSDEFGGSEAYAISFFPGGDTNLYSARFLADQDSFSGELRVNGNIELLGRPASLMAGVDRSEVSRFNSFPLRFLEYASPDYNMSGIVPNLYDNNFADIPDPGTGTFELDNIAAEDSTSVFAQLQFRPLERLSVLVGGRYDFAETSYNTLISDFSKVGLARDDSSAFTGRAAVSFDVRKNILAYGLYATSFDPVIGANRDGQILEPQTGELFEAGLKTDWLNGKLGINAAIFRLERDKIPLNRGSFGTPDFISVGPQRSEGIELEVNGTPLPGWNLSFGGVLLDAEFLGDKTVDPNVGRTPEGSADWQVGLFTSYELQGGSLHGLGAGVGLYAVDDRGLPNRDALLEGYERVDLSLFYNGFRNTSIALQVRNVFDETYVEGTNAASSGATFGSPLAALLTVRHSFGK